jgi:protocatechuate 3,4-dioxygenase beta subunit
VTVNILSNVLIKYKGFYSGTEGGIGNNVEDPKANLQSASLRGIQITDADGGAQFTTIFPGHYGGRTNHVHGMISNFVTLA